VEYKQLDLASRSSIDQFADDIKAKYSHVNILINNAGVAGFPKLTVNENNIEMQMAVNHFGHFYLTYLLWDVLKDSENLRIINVSSRAHMHNMIDSSDVNLNFEDLDGRKDYNKHRQYCRSKLANVLFTQELA
jgi:NAD(P)-dependent dehydrogenase (short-subunit alcohol dehydrogenase family)